jgi:hypothetical protein
MRRYEPRKTKENRDFFPRPLNQSGAICRVRWAESAASGKNCRVVSIARKKPPGGIFPPCPKSMLSEI